VATASVVRSQIRTVPSSPPVAARCRPGRSPLTPPGSTRPVWSVRDRIWDPSTWGGAGCFGGPALVFPPDGVAVGCGRLAPVKVWVVGRVGTSR
jgi:hypothetical protein